MTPSTPPDGGLLPGICAGTAASPGAPCPGEVAPAFQPTRGTPLAWKDYRNAALGNVEKGYLHQLLLDSGGNITKAARMAGLSRQRLYALLRKHGVMRQWVGDEPSRKK